MARINGIANGYFDEEFDPNDEISREQIAAILERYAAYKGISTENTSDISQFTDFSLISDLAEENVRWAVGNGLLTGKGGGILDYLGKATRAETAAIFQRFLEADE